MPRTLTDDEELQERSQALREAFPAMPKGGAVLIEALIAAAMIEDAQPLSVDPAEPEEPRGPTGRRLPVS